MNNAELTEILKIILQPIATISAAVIGAAVVLATRTNTSQGAVGAPATRSKWLWGTLGWLLLIIAIGAAGYYFGFTNGQPGRVFVSQDFEDHWVIHQLDQQDNVITEVIPVSSTDPTNSSQSSLRNNLELQMNPNLKPGFFLNWMPNQPFQATHVRMRLLWQSPELELIYMQVCVVPIDEALDWGCRALPQQAEIPSWISFDSDLTQPIDGVDYSNVDLDRVVISGEVQQNPDIDVGEMTLFVDDFTIE